MSDPFLARSLVESFAGEGGDLNKRLLNPVLRSTPAGLPFETSGDTRHLP